MQLRLEARLARQLAPEMERARQRVQSILDNSGMTPTLSSIPADTWDDITGLLQGAIQGQLEQVYLDAAEQLADGVNYAVSDRLLQEAATGWAEAWSFDLVQDLNTTSRAALSEALTAFSEQTMTNQELSARVASIFGPARADQIAITEVTRAAAQGESFIAGELAKQGVVMAAIWETRIDDLVCAICGPRQGMERGTNWLYDPPAHVGCRCGVRYEMRSVIQ